MTTIKVADVTKGAALLKQLIEKADTNRDGAIRTGEIDSIAPANPRVPAPARQRDLRSAIFGVVRYAQHKSSVRLPDLKKTVDAFAKA